MSESESELEETLDEELLESVPEPEEEDPLLEEEEALFCVQNLYTDNH